MEEMTDFTATVQVNIDELELMTCIMNYQEGRGMHVDTMVRSGADEYLIPMLLLAAAVDHLAPALRVKLMVIIATLNAEHPPRERDNLPF